jgi:hypothetical protein
VVPSDSFLQGFDRSTRRFGFHLQDPKSIVKVVDSFLYGKFMDMVIQPKDELGLAMTPYGGS